MFRIDTDAHLRLVFVSSLMSIRSTDRMNFRLRINSNLCRYRSIRWSFEAYYTRQEKRFAACHDLFQVHKHRWSVQIPEHSFCHQTTTTSKKVQDRRGEKKIYNSQYGSNSFSKRDVKPSASSLLMLNSVCFTLNVYVCSINLLQCEKYNLRSVILLYFLLVHVLGLKAIWWSHGNQDLLNYRCIGWMLDMHPTC